MDAPYPSNLRIWVGSTATAVRDLPLSGNGSSTWENANALEVAEQLYAWEAMNPPPINLPRDEGTEPFTLQWFLDIETQRHSRHGRWIPRLLEFGRHAGETLLGLGHGLGTDWLQYARHGASVVVCSPSVEHLGLIRRNFELRGLGGRFLHAAASSMPLEAASIDVACVSNLLHEVADPQAVVQEVFRVLKPGGKVLALTAAQYDVDFWSKAWFRWLRPKRPQSDAAAQRFSGRKLRRLFAQFTEHRIYKRQLRRSEVPHLWRWLPLSLLERMMGHVLVLKAFKPLSTAIPVPIAA